MIRDPNCKSAYSEEFDIAGLRELATMAARYIIEENYRGYYRVVGKTVPDGTYSDFDCNVWELMTALVRYGADLEKLKVKDGDSDCDSFDIGMKLSYPGYLDRINVKRRE